MFRQAGQLILVRWPRSLWTVPSPEMRALGSQPSGGSRTLWAWPESSLCPTVRQFWGLYCPASATPTMTLLRCPLLLLVHHHPHIVQGLVLSHFCALEGIGVWGGQMVVFKADKLQFWLHCAALKCPFAQTWLFASAGQLQQR